MPNQVRAESFADRTGDARLDCMNEGVFNPVAENDMRNYLSTDIALTLNTNLSGLLDGSKALMYRSTKQAL